VIKKGSDLPEHEGEGVVKSPDMSANTHNLNLGHFPFTDEYRLDLEVCAGHMVRRQTVLDFELLSRSSAIINGWWLIIGAVIGFILAKLL
jgi:hypothetical protein